MNMETPTKGSWVELWVKTLKECFANPSRGRKNETTEQESRKQIFFVIRII